MDEDSLDLELAICRYSSRYGVLHPDMRDRLISILRSADPRIRDRVAALRSRLLLASRERAGRLMDRYGLTPSEARVALHIADGGDVASYAKSACVTVGTVRVQLKSIFGKTGVRRQAALVSLLR